MKLKIGLETLSICKLSPTTPLPTWASSSSFLSITKTAQELSIVCEERLIPVDTPCEKDWCYIGVVGTLDFSLTGILSSLALSLAQAKISIFAISTFDTDYVLLKRKDLSSAVDTLKRSGFSFDNKISD